VAAKDIKARHAAAQQLCVQGGLACHDQRQSRKIRAPERQGTRPLPWTSRAKAVGLLKQADRIHKVH